MRASSPAAAAGAAVVLGSTVKAAVEPFYRVGVVMDLERRQSDISSESSIEISIGQPTLSSATDTSTSAAPTATPFLSFAGSGTLSTCSSADFQWAYSGPSTLDMTLLITNENVEQQAAPSSTSTRSYTFTRREEMTTRIAEYGGQTFYTEFLSVLLEPMARTYTWNPVNVPAGWYRLESNISSSSFHSVPFYVQEGLDTSCVLTPPTSPSGSDTTSQGSSTSGTASPTNSEPGTTASPSPVSAAASRSSHAGAIAGGVIGGIAAIAVVLLGMMCLRRRSRRARAGGLGTDPSAKSRFMGAWGNLGSFESKTAATRVPANNNVQRPDHERTDSMGAPMMFSASSSPAGTRLGHGDGSDENVHEKVPGSRAMSMESQSPFSDIPIAVYDGSSGSRPTRHSSLSSTYNFAMSRRSTSQTFPESVHNSMISSYPSGFGNYTIPPSPVAANPPSTAFTSPTSPQVPAPVAPTHARKSSRKPVPSYNPNDPAMAGAEDSRSSIPSSDEVEDAQRKMLRHNDSFNSLNNASGGGKQLHVLIPDMPPPQRR